MILADTSAWVEFLHATGSHAHLPLRELIAVVAMRSGAALLHRGHEFDVIARHTPLRLAS